MRGGALPPSLLFAALGVALAFAPRRAWVPSLITLGATVAALSFVSLPQSWIEGVFFGCWTSVAITAATVHLSRGLNLPGALTLSLNAGVWSSAVDTLSGSRSDLLKALPCMLLLFPASWVIARQLPIPVKVVSSWVIAVAILAGALQLLPVTPGYLPDHLE